MDDNRWERKIYYLKSTCLFGGYAMISADYFLYNLSHHCIFHSLVLLTVSNKILHLNLLIIVTYCMHVTVKNNNMQNQWQWFQHQDLLL